jgi:pSer/pThr/pTyr-binding forkhead associated (FHA) protein
MFLGEFAEHIQGITREEFSQHYPGPYLLFGGLDISPNKQALRSLGGRFDHAPGERVLIGRKNACPISIDEPDVEPEHALFRHKSGPPNQGWYLYDLGTPTSCRLNGLRLLPKQPYLISTGDNLHIGATTKATFFEAAQIHDLMSSFETRMEFKAFDLNALLESNEHLPVIPFANTPHSPTPRPDQGFSKSTKSFSSSEINRHWVHCPPMRPVLLQEGNDFIIGREPELPLCLPHPKISRQHAVLRLIDGSIWIEDLSSTNGTLVSDFQIPSGSKSPVSPSQVIKIGPFEIQINKDSSIIKSRISDMGHRTTQAMVAGGDLSEEIIFSGHLSEMSVEELLNRCVDRQKTGTLILEDMFTEATLIFSSGLPVHAENGDLNGEEALESMFNISDGRFSFKNAIEFPDESNLTLNIEDFRQRFLHNN